jgi:hypothetical protein
MVTSRHQNEGQDHNLMTGVKFFINVAKIKYFEATVTNHNYTHKQIKSRLNSWDAYSYSVQNILSSCILCKNLKLKIYKNVNLHDVLYGYGTSSFTQS